MTKPITQSQFDAHCKENQLTAAKLEKLMPLADLIPTLKDIVENQKASVYMGRKIMRTISVIATIVGLVWLVVQFWKAVK